MTIFMETRERIVGHLGFFARLLCHLMHKGCSRPWVGLVAGLHLDHFRQRCNHPTFSSHVAVRHLQRSLNLNFSNELSLNRDFAPRVYIEILVLS